MKVVYQGVLFPPDEDGLSACALFGMPVHGVGTSPENALQNAAEILQDAIEHLSAEGENVPEPVDPPADELARGVRVAVVATVPAMAAA